MEEILYSIYSSSMKVYEKPKITGRIGFSMVSSIA